MRSRAKAKQMKCCSVRQKKWAQNFGGTQEVAQKRFNRI